MAVDRADAPRDDRGRRHRCSSLLSAAPPLVIAFFVGQHYQLGVRTGWYLFLQSAYGAWSPLTTVMAVVTLLAAWRLVGTATARLLPESGD